MRLSYLAVVITGWFACSAVLAAETVRICLAPSSASLIGMQGADASNAIDEMLAGYLSGPSLETVRLLSRLRAQVRQEAAEVPCDYLLFTVIKQERRNSAFPGRLAAGAIFSGASNAAVVAETAGGRVLAGAAAGAAETIVMSNDVRLRDQVTMTFDLEDPGGTTISRKTDKRRAGADGEDLLTPLIESTAEAVSAALAKR